MKDCEEEYQLRKFETTLHTNEEYKKINYIIIHLESKLLESFTNVQKEMFITYDGLRGEQEKIQIDTALKQD